MLGEACERYSVMTGSGIFGRLQHPAAKVEDLHSYNR